MRRIKWKTEQRVLSELVPWERNPRQLTEQQAEHLEASLQKFDLVEPIAINLDNTIIGGHQRTYVMALMKEFGEDAAVDVRVPSRELTAREVEELNIRLNANNGQWDFDMLGDAYELEDLYDWGFPDWQLPPMEIEPPSLDDLEDEYGEGTERDFWPIIRVQVSPATFQRWQEIMGSIDGEDDAQKVEILLNMV